MELNAKLENYQKEKVIDSAMLIANKLYNLAVVENNRLYMAKSSASLGTLYLQQSFTDSSNYYYQIAYESYLDISDSVLAGEMIIRKAFNQKIAGESKESIRNYQKGIDLLSISTLPYWLGMAHDHVGYQLFKQGDYYAALNHYQKGIAAVESIGDTKNVGVIYNKIGLLYRKIQDPVKEEAAYIRALSYLEAKEPTVYLAEVYNNLSEIIIDKGEVEKGLSILEKAKVVYNEIDYPLGMCSYYLVHAYHQSVSVPANYYKVIEYANLGLPIAEEYEDWRMYADFNIYLGEAYFYTGQVKKAEKTLLKSIKLAEENEFLPEVQKASEALYQLYREVDDSKNALFYMNRYIHLRDSLQGAQKLKEFTELDLSFKFKQEQIKDSIGQLQEMQKVELEHAQELERQSLLRLIYIVLILLVIVIAAFIYYNARKNKKQAEILKDKNRIIQDSLDDKEVLIKEIHHRVKNNLQLVSSLLELQSKEIDDEKALKSIHDGQERVRAMALIHQKLYQNKNLNTINIKDYVQLLINDISVAYSVEKRIQFIIHCKEIHFDIDTAIPLGLILNELITNAVKHAFSDNIEPKIEIGVNNYNKEYYQLIVKDNGLGFNEGLDIKSLKSLGIKMVKRLTKQLHGKIDIRNNNGCEFDILFKDSIQRSRVE